MLLTSQKTGQNYAITGCPQANKRRQKPHKASLRMCSKPEHKTPSHPLRIRSGPYPAGTEPSGHNTQRRGPRAHTHPRPPPHSGSDPEHSVQTHTERAQALTDMKLCFRLHEREQNRLTNTGLTHHSTRTLRILLAGQQHNQTVNTRPIPPIGGAPCSRARRKSSSSSIASSSPAAASSDWAVRRSR